MCDLVHAQEDCWMGVEDPKKRKQIQDRLAQRARRKRLASAKAEPGGSSRAVLEPAQPNRLTSVDTAEMPRMAIPLNAYSALWKNGTFLGLSCSIVTNTVSSEPGPDVPESLRPTPRQLMTAHPLWIDRFPFPTMRDNFISLLDVIDPDDFLHDIFNGRSFSIEAGGVSWDPSVWRVEKEFKAKWGFLFDKDLFGSTTDTPQPDPIATDI